MAQLDVQDVLLDPTFVDPIIVIRRTAGVNQLGQNVICETPIPTIGTVEPASGETIRRLPQAMQVANVMSFWVQQVGLVVDTTSGGYPDIICFNGQRFTIQVVFPYSNWGHGFSEGTCVRMKPSLGGSG